MEEIVPLGECSITQASCQNNMSRELLLMVLLTASCLFCAGRADPHNCTASQFYNNAIHQCSSCSSNCLSCTSISNCSQCASAYYASSNTTCTPCSKSNCAFCPNDSCIYCKSGYDMQADGSTCSPSNSSIFLAYLIGAICLGLILLVSCCCYCFNKCRNRNALQNLRRQHEVRLHIIPEPESQQEIKFDENWVQDQAFSERKNETCPFCLDQLVNLQLPCRHLYHIGCISRWLARHSECPVCKRSVTGEAKLYCSQCFGFDIKFDSSLITTSKLLNKRMCEKCTAEKKLIIPLQ